MSCTTNERGSPFEEMVQHGRDCIGPMPSPLAVDIVVLAAMVKKPLVDYSEEIHVVSLLLREKFVHRLIRHER